MFIGLVGKPSAGKSTFFKALTLMDIDIANYPFTTIKPNSGIGYVSIDCVDKEFNTTCEPREGYCKRNKRFIPVKILDVAGLVPGAHKGKGLGLEFLNDLSQADCLIHIVDISGSLNERGEPVPKGNYEPAKDILFLEKELDMWYFQICKRAWNKFSYTVNQTKEDVVKAIAAQFSGLKVTEEMVKRALKHLRLDCNKIIAWDEQDLQKLTRRLRKESKPIIIAANKIDVAGSSVLYKRVKDAYPDKLIIPCSAEAELALKEAANHELIAYLPGGSNFSILQEKNLNEKQKHGLQFIKKILSEQNATGVQKVINKAIFGLLDYIAVFPVPDNKLRDAQGRVLPDCFLVPKGTTPLEFAYHIHTDIGNKFIKAIDIKTSLALKKDEPLKHRAVIEIVHN